MKIGVLTFVHTSNYGAVLQAYALQTLLLTRGIDNELIDYVSPSVLKNHDPKQLRHRQGLLNKLALPFLYAVYAERLGRFLDFEKKYLTFSAARYDRETIGRSEANYDRFLVGSDQVWNPVITGGDMSYFLDFVSEDEKKLSYAASLGGAALPLEYREKCCEYLRRFAAVNVREASAAERLRVLGVTAETVPDPTLMLKKEEWLPLVGARPHGKKYIFMYMPPTDRESVRRIREYAKKCGLDVFQVRKGIKPTRGFRTLNTLSPTEFLTWLYHAEHVVSGSFHGVCFSILFEKHFWAFSDPKKPLSVRIDDLLRELGLSDRTLRPGMPPHETPIDYGEANGRLEALRASASTILEKMLGAK